MSDNTDPLSQTADEPLVLVSRDRDIVRVSLNRPRKRNALTRELIEQLTGAIKQAAEESTTRGLIVAAEGTVYCAGMDLGEMESRARAADAEREWRRDTDLYRDLLVTIFQAPFPTLAAVQGPVVAGGVGIISACDVVIASESANVSLPEPKRGITAAIVSPFLTYRVGPGTATAMLLTASELSATEMFRVGLCHEVAPPPDLDQRIACWCEKIRASSPAALALTKKHMLDCFAGPVYAHLEASTKLSAQARQMADAREGLAAFLEKRKTRWNQC